MPTFAARMSQIQLSDHFTYRKLLRFTLPSMVMMVFISIYSVIDGLFVSNLVGKTAFAALNLVYPFLMMLAVVGLMFGTGGSALVAKILGEGDSKRANSLFSLFVYAVIVLGTILAILGEIFMPQIVVWLGGEGELIPLGILYGRILLVALPAFALQMAFQSFMVAAEKPNLGLKVALAAGFTNIILDFVFIRWMGWGLEGAAWATAIGQFVGGGVPMIYFARRNSSLLRLGRCRYDHWAMCKACANGSSEMVTNLAVSLVSMLYNYQLMQFVGENGVAAYGVIMYVNFVFLAIFIGYSMGSAPIVSYHFGAKNQSEMQNLYRKSLRIILTLGVSITILAELLAHPLSWIFVGFDQELFLFTRRAFMIFSLSFLLAGFNVYASAFFTALNNGLVSAGISFSRTLVFECGAVMLLPLLFGIDGIWSSVVVAEGIGVVLSVTMLCVFRKKYGY